MDNTWNYLMIKNNIDYMSFNFIRLMGVYWLYCHSNPPTLERK